MSLSNNRQAYEDCYEVMDKALDLPDGVRIGFGSKEEAAYYRFRMNKARQLDREFSRERYEMANPKRGRSDYDVLMFRIRENSDMFWVYAEKKPQRGVIEPIDGSEERPRLVKSETKRIIAYRRT